MESEESDLLAHLDEMEIDEPHPTRERSLENLLAAFDEQVSARENHILESSQRADAAFASFLSQCDTILQYANTLVGNKGPERFQLQQLRNQLILEHDKAALAKKELLALYDRQVANIATLVSNVVLNHLSRGQQTAPFLVAAPQEESAVAFRADNPALPPNSYVLADLETRRVNLF